MLKFNGTWSFDSPGQLAGAAVNDFSALIGKVAAQGEQQRILEHFKSYFASAAGGASSWSSNASWAQTDLDNSISQAAENAPLFIEAFFDACDALQKRCPDIVVPDATRINRILATHKTGYTVEPPNLIAKNPEAAI